MIGFPNGNMTTKTKEFETKDAIENGADRLGTSRIVKIVKKEEAAGY